MNLGTRDARKELQLGCSGEREMEEPELEEGEACSYHSNGNYNGAECDPDVAFAYIDEKLKDVLGHFQKDFEGGVSAENLGAKFGGYGSFLPTYQRSPIHSHSRSPAKPQNCAAPKSPNNFQLEGGHRNPAISSSVHQSVRTGYASNGATLLPAVTPFKNDSVKQELCMSSTNRADGFAPNHESAKKKSAKIPDQRALKVRIRVGSDNLSAQKNAAIYSDLGIDVSPSPSLDDSLSESGGMSRELQYGLQESPTSILRVMTSVPLHGGLVLSPLPEDALYLKAKEKLLKDSRTLPVSRAGCDPVKSGRKVVGENNMKLVQENDFSGKPKTGKATQSNHGILPKKEADIDVLTCEELLSNTLKLPLLSNCTIGDTRKDTGKTSSTSRESHKAGGTKQVHSDLSKEEILQLGSAQGDGRGEKSKFDPSSNVWEDKKESLIDGDTIYPSKDSHQKGGKACKSVKNDLLRGFKGQEMDLIDSMERDIEKVTYDEHDGTEFHSGKEILSSGVKKKTKGSHSHSSQATESPKGFPRDDSSLPRTKRNTGTENYTYKSGSEDFKLDKDLGKSRDKYREIFGDMEDEEEENQMDTLEFSSGDRQKNPGVARKRTCAISIAPRERMNYKNSVNAFPSEAQFKVDSNFAPHSSNLPSLETTVAPVLEDNWVQCEKCHKWRLLPIDRNCDNLPEKWLCVMLDWLPGMDKCSISEEETTRAVYELYGMPVPERQNHGHGNTAGGGATSASVHPPSHILHVNSFPEPNGGKKKHRPKEMSDAMSADDIAQLSGSVKQKVTKSVKGRISSDVNQSRQVSEPGFQKVSRSTDLSPEKFQRKQKEKHRSLDHFSVGGDSKKSNKKGKRESDQDMHRPFKKMKAGDMKLTSEGWTFNNGPAASEEDTKCNHNSLSRDDYDSIGAQVSVRKGKQKFEVSRTDKLPDMRRHGIEELTGKKRKLKDCPEPQSHEMPLPGTRHHFQDRAGSVEELSENNGYRKEKKPKVSKSGGRETSASKGNGRLDKISQSNNQFVGQNVKGTSHGLSPMKRVSGCVQPLAAATSSSSKISGSHKSRNSFQEVKGSPVESVSSSPMRIQNPDKLLPTRKTVGKEESQGNGYCTGSPRKCSDGEEDAGSNRSGPARAEKNFHTVHRGSVDSSTLNCRDSGIGRISNIDAKFQTARSPDVKNQHLKNGIPDNLKHGNHHSVKKPSSDCYDGGDKLLDNHFHANGPSARKSSKARSNDNIRVVKPEIDRNENGISGFRSELRDCTPSHKAKPEESNGKLKFGNRSHKIDNEYVVKKESSGKLSHENGKGGVQSICGDHDGPDVKEDAICNQDRVSTPSKTLMQNCEVEKSGNRPCAEKNDQERLYGREKSLPLPPSGVGQNETLPCCEQSAVDSQKETGSNNLAGCGLEGDDAPKVPKMSGKASNDIETQQISSRHRMPNGHKARDIDAPSPLRRESSSQAATNALKEAKDLKHFADRLKNSGSISESTGHYFQAALKFLHGASLLESSNNQNGRHGDMIQSIKMYSSTAKLCEYCAHEYERSKDMASAALAYKCTEIAYMRVVYSSHSSASRDRQELQTALQMVAPGESPSSSASDVDNVNNLVPADKAALAKGISSSQVAGNHIITSRNRHYFVRLLNFAQDVNLAMEASRKSRIAFSAANVRLGEMQLEEGIASIKRALDFNFQDVEGLLRLVRLAMEAISR